MRSPANRCQRQVVAVLLTAVVVIAPLVVLCRAQPTAQPFESQDERQANNRLVVGKPDEQQSERLLASLNESLARFLQTTSDFGGGGDEDSATRAIDNRDSSKNNQSSKQQQHQQQLQLAQQQQSVALKKISCNKISLVVMAQRALNASASPSALRKLAECRRHNLLDLELVELLERSTTATETTPETSRLESFNLNKTNARQQQQQQQRDKTVRQQLECPPEAKNCATATEWTDSEQALHLGAKLAIVLVAAVLMLVCVATLVDCCHQSEGATRGRPNCPHRLAARRTAARDNSFGGKERAGNTGAKNRGARELNASRFFLDLGPQAAKLRDYRSLSISSNSSSNLFCSSNSVASSSAPILSNGSNQQQQQHRAGQHNNHTHQDSLQPTSNQPNHQQHQLHSCTGQYDSNLQLHLGQVHTQSRASSSLGGGNGSAEDSAEPGRRRPTRSLGEQILLAFSLRQTAGQIFAGQQQQPSEESGEGDRQESVDWLHGLRFFSMIWVIVIHSYNFALRWMFFSNTSTLDGIYKSTASQFIANGSFACDSFFFVGGFLLPYLALRPVGGASKHDVGGTSATISEDYGNGTSEEEVAVEEANSHVRHQQVSAAGGERQDELDEQLSESACFCCACGGCGGSLTGSCRQRAAACTKHSSSLCVLEECPSATSTDAITTCFTASCHCFKRGPFESTQTLCGANFSNEQNNNNKVGLQQQQHRNLAANTNELSGRQPGASRPSCEFQHVHTPQPVSKHYSAAAAEDLNNSETTTAKAKLDQKLTESWAGHKPPTTTTSQFSWRQCLANVLRRYVRMMPLMMAIIALCANLLRYLGEGPVWQESTMMYDDWCRRNWWVNVLFLHNFVNRENMCLSHSWYSAVDFQLFLCGQLLLLALCRHRRLGLALLLALIFGSPLITMVLTLKYHLPAVPLISSVNEQTMNVYYGEIYIKPYSRASPYLIGILLAYLMRTTSLGQWRLKKWQVAIGWTLAIGLLLAIIMAMQPAMNGHSLTELESAFYSGWSRPLWACAASWIIFACITRQAGFIGTLLGARCFVPLSKLTYPAFLIHPIIMASFYGTRQASFQFSHYLMLYLILGNIVITYASAFVLAALVELPCLSIERAISRRLFKRPRRQARHHQSAGSKI